MVYCWKELCSFFQREFSFAPPFNSYWNFVAKFNLTYIHNYEWHTVHAHYSLPQLLPPPPTETVVSVNEQVYGYVMLSLSKYSSSPVMSYPLRQICLDCFWFFYIYIWAFEGIVYHHPPTALCCCYSSHGLWCVLGLSTFFPSTWWPHTRECPWLDHMLGEGPCGTNDIIVSVWSIWKCCVTMANTQQHGIYL